MNKKVLLSLIAAGWILMLCASANAEWYMGASSSYKQVLPYPESLSKGSLTTNSFANYRNNNLENSLSLYGGYRAANKFSLQLEYQDDLSFGIDDMFAGSSLWFPETSTQNFESNALFLSGISSYPINDSGVFYLKGGLFNWEFDTNYYESSEKFLGRTSGTDFFYGLGANYDLNTRFGISAEWERYQMQESDVDYLSTKLKFKF